MDKGDAMETTVEDEIYSLYKKGVSMGEIAVMKHRSVKCIATVLAQQGLAVDDDVAITEMPMQWVKDWLALNKKYGRKT